ncbi:hypothetical protein [Nonomuraea endophytica]|uniref:Ppx/GppA phosphatase domain-containing protein n=1 Tax=Nonomuraea endophytica TaxID=714136 RepID=A0A7W8AHA5_9ACTN|nr:hypothetical protein [Nonomuraea endophytica]MBB5085086.1 hypothetical protein [Nonomuraea endophytica]
MRLGVLDIGSNAAHLRISVLAGGVGEISALHLTGHATAVATSRTFHQLARLCGAPAAKAGPHVARRLNRDDVREAIELLAGRIPLLHGLRVRRGLAVNRQQRRDDSTADPLGLLLSVHHRRMRDSVGTPRRPAR